MKAGLVAAIAVVAVGTLAGILFGVGPSAQQQNGRAGASSTGGV